MAAGLYAGELGHCAAARLGFLIGVGRGVFPIPLKSARRVAPSPKLGGYCGQGRIYGSRGLHPPDLAVRLRPTPDGRLIRRGPRRLKTDIEDKGAFTGRMGYAHPTDALRLRPTPVNPSRLEPRALPLAMTSSAVRRQKAAQAAQARR